MNRNGYVEWSQSGKVATITFFHPSRNALPGNILDDLAQSINDAGSKDDVHIIVLCSAGDRTFCAGASFEELMAVKDEQSGKAFFSGFAKVINAARKCPRIIIGRVQGKAVGGGVGLLSCTDLCYATSYASLRLSELAIGIGPFVIAPVVERKVGRSVFSEMALDPEQWYGADQALKAGFYNKVLDDIESLDRFVAEKASQLAGYNPEALALLKKVFWEGTEHWDELLLQRAAMSGRLVLSGYTSAALRRVDKK